MHINCHVDASCYAMMVASSMKCVPDCQSQTLCIRSSNMLTPRKRCRDDRCALLGLPAVQPSSPPRSCSRITQLDLCSLGVISNTMNRRALVAIARSIKVLMHCWLDSAQNLQGLQGKDAVYRNVNQQRRVHEHASVKKW